MRICTLYQERPPRGKPHTATGAAHGSPRGVSLGWGWLSAKSRGVVVLWLYATVSRSQPITPDEPPTCWAQANAAMCPTICNGRSLRRREARPCALCKDFPPPELTAKRTAHFSPTAKGAVIGFFNGLNSVKKGVCLFQVNAAQLATIFDLSISQD